MGSQDSLAFMYGAFYYEQQYCQTLCTSVHVLVLCYVNYNNIYLRTCLQGNRGYKGQKGYKVRIMDRYILHYSSFIVTFLYLS